MSKTSVEVDRDITRPAAAILGTATLRDTINAPLREIVDAKRRLELIALLSDPECVDVRAAAWGGDEQMPSVEFVADTSVFARLSQPVVAARFAPLAATASVAICAPVAFEIGYAARNHDDYVAITDRLASFPSVPVTDADHRRALEVQVLLGARGQHRALSLVDALVAAVAEARALTVLHYDSDLELVAEVTGQAHQWIVARGSAD